MADTKTTGLTALTALDAADLVMVVDVSDTTFDAAGTNKKITKSNLLKPTGADANTVTGTAGTSGNLGSWNVDGDLVDSTVAVADVLVEGDKTGADVAVVSGTAGTSGNLATWNVDGDLVDGPTPPSGTIVGTTDAQTLTNKTLTTPVISAISNTGTVTLPTATDTLVGRDTTDTLTNKTIDAASNTLLGLPTEIGVACSDETTSLTTGTAKATFRMPYAMTLTAARASVTTAPVGSTIIVDINEGGITVLSTKISIDASEKTSTTAVAPPVISDSALADDAEITIDIDQVGSSTPGAGLKVWLIGTRA